MQEYFLNVIWVEFFLCLVLIPRKSMYQFLGSYHSPMLSYDLLAVFFLFSLLGANSKQILGPTNFVLFHLCLYMIQVSISLLTGLLVDFLRIIGV